METVTPEEVGFSSNRLGRIRQVMQGYVDERKLAGLITLVARKGKLVHFEKYGLMDIAAQKEMRGDAIFRIASMTKPITTVGAMMLYEEGHFQLSDPVSRFIPGLQGIKVEETGADGVSRLVDAGREPAMRDLMIHTSGLNVHFLANKSLAENMQELVKRPLLDQPGTLWRYKQSTNVLAYVLELISGMPLERFLQERIFDPLQMADTGFLVPQDKLERFCAVYWRPAEDGLKLVEGAQDSIFASPRRLCSGSSGIVSTAADYLRFAQMLLNGGELDGVDLLGRKTVDFMMYNHLADDLRPFEMLGQTYPGYGFGLGGYVVLDRMQTQTVESAGSFGWLGAYNTYFWIDRAEEMVGLLLAQFVPLGVYPLEAQFKTLAYQALVA